MAPGTPTCGPFGENLVYTRADGMVVNGTRDLAGFPNTIGTDAWFKNKGNSNYNALLTLKHTSRRLTPLASYTYGKSLDWSPNLPEQVNPFNYRAERGISAFDIKYNFALSYDYEVPLEKLFHSTRRLTEGWAMTGTARFCNRAAGYTGQQWWQLPRPRSKQRSQLHQPRSAQLGPWDLHINGNPRNRQPYFNTALFSPNAIGTQGNAPRRPFYGPAVNKVTKINGKQITRTALGNVQRTQPCPVLWKQFGRWQH